MGTIWQPALTEGKGPKYKSVAAAIRDGIAKGHLLAGEKLPPVRDLAWRLAITPGTVARAYTLLTDEGLLAAEVGRGTFVAAAKTDLHDDIWSRQAELSQPDTISLFSPRLPDMGQVAAIRRAMVEVSKNDASDFLNYPTRDAYRPVREAVMGWQSDVSVGSCTQSDVILAHGGQSAITLVMQAVLTGPKPVIIVEDLSYAGFRRAAEILRVEVIGVPMDGDGVIPEALEAAVRSSGAQLFCTSPEVQNPTGLFTPEHRRRALQAVCARNAVQILEDDCYRLAASRAPGYRVLNPGISWYVSSISKTLTPALRIGYAVAAQGRGPDLRRVSEYSFFGLARPLAEVARSVLSDPETKAIADRVRARLGEYVQVAVNALGGFELTWNPDVPFVWLRLPSGWRAAGFCRAAEAEGIQIRSADEFALRDGRAPHAVRIAMNAQVSIDNFEAAMMRLRMLLDNPPEQISV